MTEHHPHLPDIGCIVHYRGKHGLQTLRPAMIVATRATLDPRGVEADQVSALGDDMHVHLHVFTPSEQGFFPEYNVPHTATVDDAEAEGFEDGIAPGTWAWPVRT